MFDLFLKAMTSFVSDLILYIIKRRTRFLIARRSIYDSKWCFDKRCFSKFHYLKQQRGELSLTYRVSYLTGDEDSRATPNLILETLFFGIYICPVSVCKPWLISAVISGDI